MSASPAIKNSNLLSNKQLMQYVKYHIVPEFPTLSKKKQKYKQMFLQQNSVLDRSEKKDQKKATLTDKDF